MEEIIIDIIITNTIVAKYNKRRKVVKTGSREKWCANNIYDFAGNVDEWTQEQNKSPFGLFRAIRGGIFSNCGSDFPVTYRYCGNPISYYFYTGLRATLYIK